MLLIVDTISTIEVLSFKLKLDSKRIPFETAKRFFFHYKRTVELLFKSISSFTKNMY